ncbi:MAG: SDR family oxidoreductase, partial [Chloroflexota bacterium]
MMKIQGKTAVIAGGSSGIGKGIALALAEKGAKHIVLLARRQSKLDEAAKEIEATGTAVSTHSLNLGDSDAVQATAKKIRQAIGTPDIIVNSAGAGSLRSLVHDNDDNIVQHIESTCYAAFFLTRAFLGEMLQRDSGSIVMVGSPAINVNIGAPAYMSSRAAIWGFARSLRYDLSNSKLHVLYAEPSLVYDTDYFGSYPGTQEIMPVAFRSPAFRFMHQTSKEVGLMVARGIERNGRYAAHWISHAMRLTGSPFLRFYEWFFRKTSLTPEAGGPLFAK